jgi:hypothetical protein
VRKAALSFAFVMLSTAMIACGDTRPPDQTAGQQEEPRQDERPETPSPDPKPTVIAGSCPGSDGEGKPTSTDSDQQPVEAIAVTDEGRVVIIETKSGREVRELVDLSDEVREFDFPIESVALAPDGRHAYYTHVVGRRKVICRISLISREVEAIVDGAAPSISPDGRLLAYAVRTEPADMYNGIAVLNLASGSRRVWKLPPDEEDFFQVFGSINKTSWAPGSRRIAYTLYYEGPETRLLDINSARSLRDAVLLHSSGAGFFDSPSYLPDGLLALVQSCCFPEMNRQPGRLVLLNTSTGGVGGTGGPPEVRSVDADSTGAYFLLVTKSDELVWIGPDRTPHRIGSGFVAAQW